MANCMQFTAGLVVLLTLQIHRTRSSSILDCENIKTQVKGTVYENASHFWPLKSSSSLVDVITCHNALSVSGTISNVTSSDGLYGIAMNGLGGVKLPTSSQDQKCLKSFTACSNGLSIAFWINLLPSSKSHASGFDVVMATQDSLRPLTGLALFDSYNHGLQVSVRISNSTETKPISIQRSVWNHVVITWTSDDNITHYVNSKMASENTNTVREHVSRTKDTSAGLYLSYSTVAGQSKASFRDLVIWHQRISEKDVKDIYRHTPGCQEIDPATWTLSASSSTDYYTPASASFDSRPAWCEDPEYTGGYLEIKLPFVYNLNTMVIKPKEYGTKEYLTSFKVMHSGDAVKWTYYDKILPGVASGDNFKKIEFENPTIVARYFRIYPTEGNGRRCVRVRLCGVKQVLNISAAVQMVSGASQQQCSIKVNGKEYCPDKDGHNVVTINHYTGTFQKAQNFETHAKDTAGELLQQFISSLANGTVIVVAVKTSGHRISKKGTKALYSIGARSLNRPPANTPWILIGRKGFLQKWIREELAATAGGSVAVDLMIPLSTDIQPSHFWPLQQVDYLVKAIKYLRDIRGGMDMYYKYVEITMGLLRISVPSSIRTKNNKGDCVLQPEMCPGGVSMSVWLKVEHSSLLHGEKDEQWDQILYHRPQVILSSWSSGYIQIEGRTYSAKTGHTVVLMDYGTGQITGQAVFDPSIDVTAQDRFAQFLITAPNGTVVLISARKASTLHPSSTALVEALKAVGAKDPVLTSVECYVFAGYKGLDSMRWVQEIKVHAGSLTLRKSIPFFRSWMSETGMQDGRIQDWQFTSNLNTSLAQTTPHYARLYSVNAGWNGGTTIGSYIQITLATVMLINGIKTQGSSTEAVWVQSYRLSYSTSDVLWFVIKDGSIATEFVGNSDQHTAVQHTFRRPICCRVVRITPIVFHIKMVMRLEILQLNNAFKWMADQPQLFQQEILGGPKALVFHDRTRQSITRIISSSDRNEQHSADKAALHNTKSSISSGCWCPSTDQNQFLSVFLSERSLVTSIGVQGCPSTSEWVTEFFVKYQDHGEATSQMYMENGAIKNLKGSFDKRTVVISDLNQAIYATVIAIHPKTWHQHPCMRFEIYGYPLQTECFSPLGVNNSIPNARLSASSFKSTFEATHARLGVGVSAWCVELQSQVYLQIDLSENTLVSGIASQGYNQGSWTKSFYIGYSHSSLTWFNHTRDDQLLIYEANKDGISVVVNTISPYIEARYVRIYPREGSQSHEACLRVELYGCFKENPAFALTGPVEMDAANSSEIVISGSYRFCPSAMTCPTCKRQVYIDVFGTTDCVVSEVLYDCQYHIFETLLQVPSLPNTYNIRVFDYIGKACDINMKRTVSGKIIGRVLVKVYQSTSCLDVLLKGHRHNGIYNIRPAVVPGSMMPVYCDQMRQGGGWTVIQRRINGTVDFYKTWDEYKHGFGSLEGELWLGNDNIHRLASSPVELLIEMETFTGVYYYAKYDSFQIEGESKKYKLHVSGYSGTAGDSLTAVHNGSKFSTKDQNNDAGSLDCPSKFHSAWWYKSCKDADLNGVYVPNKIGNQWKGIKWEALLGLNGNLKSVEMKVRPKQGSTIKCYYWGCFYLIKGNFKFDTARRACWSMGGDLATIKNEAENNDIASIVAAAGLPPAQIGINDILKEGQFEGPDGSAVDSYSNWAAATNGDKDCVTISGNKKWYPADCSNYYRSSCVCQRGIMCFKSSCYYLNGTTLITRDNARLACHQHGSKLMKIPGASKSEFIQKYLMPHPGIELWIGLSDEVNEGSFMWNDDSTLIAPYWNTNQPSGQNAGDDCVVLATNGKWKTKPCSQTAGQVCQKQIARSCQELLELGETKSGIYFIYAVQGGYSRPMKVYCDQEKDGGGWEILLRRKDGSVTFHDKKWNDFEIGFGNLEQEFWLGLKNFYGLGNRELMNRFNNSDGTSKYDRWGYCHVTNDMYKMKVGKYREGTLDGQFSRFNGMKFSSPDKDNDYDTSKVCTNTFGPGWLWSVRIDDKRLPMDCYDAGVNLFGAYSPASRGNSKQNLFHGSFGRPITYFEMKTRLYKDFLPPAWVKNRLLPRPPGKDSGFQRAIITTMYPMERGVHQGFSLFHSPHELTLHIMTTSKGWTLSISPNYDWTHYTFTWSNNYGLRSYENGILSLQTRFFRNASCLDREYLILGVSDVHISDSMLIFMSRLRTWDKEITIDEIKSDFHKEDFTLEEATTRWNQDRTNTFNWTLNSNSTLSNYTGPSFDRTYSGLPQGSYYYVEASYPRYQGQTSAMFSPVFFANHHKCFQFWYHMHGRHMGELMLNMVLYSRLPYQSNVVERQQLVWNQEGDLGNQWRHAMIKVDVADLFKFTFTGVVGADFRSDMAIDDLSITTSQCPNISRCVPDCKQGFTCLQDKAMCDCKGMKHVDSSCNYVLTQSVFKGSAHHWPLDDPKNITNTQGSVHGFTTGNVVAVRGPVNYALNTDGITGQITLADMKSSCILLSPSCPFTLRFWLKVGQNDEKQTRVYLSLGHDKKMARGLQFLQDFSVIDKPGHVILNATIDKLSCIIGFKAHPSIWSTITLSWAKTKGFTLYHNRENVTYYLFHKCESVVSVSPSNTFLRTGFDGNLPALTLDDVTLWYKEINQTEVVKLFRFFTAPENTITLSIKFPGETYSNRMQDRESKEFKTIDAKILQNAQSIFTGTSNHFAGTRIEHLSDGCVIARLSLLFEEITNTELELLGVALCSTQLFGRMKGRLVGNSVTVIKNSLGVTTRKLSLCETSNGLSSHGLSCQGFSKLARSYNIPYGNYQC